MLDSNRLTAGPMMSRFEREIASLHGCRYGLMCDSGTAALQIALAALKESCGWSDGDEILVPAVTFVATANVVVYNNLRPVFVDVEPAYYTIDPAQIEKRITSRTRAIIPVHIGCLPCDMSPILEIAAAARAPDRRGLGGSDVRELRGETGRIVRRHRLLLDVRGSHDNDGRRRAMHQ